MLKKLIFVFFLVSLGIHGQNTVKGTLTSGAALHEWIIVYQLKGASQQYLLNTNITDGEFSFELPVSASPGMYRITYNMDNSGFVDFLYNKEDVTLSFDPDLPLSTVEFQTSQENILYRDYFIKAATVQAVLDSIQFSMFTGGTIDAAANEAYTSRLEAFKALQQEFEAAAANTLALHFIKAENKYYSPVLLETPQEYLNTVKAHYFDYLDLNSETLFHSSLISERVVDYVFYLNTSEDPEIQHVLYRQAVDEVLARLEGNDPMRSEVLTILLQAFTQLEHLQMVNYIIDNQYNNLPSELKDPGFIEEISHRMRLAVGQIAPDFDFAQRGAVTSLHALEGKAYYVLVFWSSDCPHCLEEMPRLHAYLESNTEIEVLAVALENDATAHGPYTSAWTGWTHIIATGKWDSTMARLYDITSTPTYFVLDAEKTIIGKPEFFEDLQWFFEDQK